MKATGFEFYNFLVSGPGLMGYFRLQVPGPVWF